MQNPIVLGECSKFFEKKMRAHNNLGIDINEIKDVLKTIDKYLFIMFRDDKLTYD